MPDEPTASAPTREADRLAATAPDQAATTPSGCSDSARLPDAPPGYELLGELGRGGMGVVYQARQIAANRVVALKMILAGGHASAAERRRFRTEAESVAKLNHPGIVQVYEVGECNGLPFFSMEFCGGGSLARRLNRTPLPADQAATLCEALAHAVGYAHGQGVIHRDLKPANVLLVAPLALAGKITDFGLAKQIEADGDGPTRTGAVMGTPSYMSPEQALGASKRVGPAADIYALGAILYECLTGRPPFQGATALDTLEQVRYRDPVPPRQLAPSVPRDLETICLKCLQKDPARRYASAEDLAADLRRFGNGEPIRARPVGAFEKATKWAARNPAVAGLLALVVLVTVASFAVILYQNQRVTFERDEALDARNNEKTAKETAVKALAGESAAREEAEASQARAYLALARRELDAGEKRPAWLALLDCRDRDRGWEWHWLYRQADPRPRSFRTPVDPVIRYAVDDENRWVAVGAERIVRVFALDGGRQLAQLPGLPAGIAALGFRGEQLLVVGRDGALSVHAPPTGERLGGVALGGAIRGPAVLSSDGTLVAVQPGQAGGRVEVYETATGRQLAGWQAPDVPRALSLAADGSRLAYAYGDGPAGKGVEVRRAATGEKLLALAGPFVHAVLSPDGRRLASLAGETFQVHDVATGRAIFAEEKAALNTTSPFVFTPDGRRLLVRHPLRPGVLRVWDAAVRDWLPGGESAALSVDARLEFSPDGTFLVAGAGHHVHVRDHFSAGPACRLHLPGNRALAVSLHPRTGRVVALSKAGHLHEWDRHTGQPVGEPFPVGLPTGEDQNARLAFTPDGERLLVANGSATAVVLDVATRRTLARFTAERGVVATAWSPDGTRVLLASEGGFDIGNRGERHHPMHVALWDVPSGRKVREHVRDDWHEEVRSLAFTPDGGHYAASVADRGVVVWSADGEETSAARGQLACWERPAGADRRLAILRPGGVLELYDCGTGRADRALRGPSLSDAKELLLTPDLRRLLSTAARAGGQIDLWSTAGGPRVFHLPGQFCQMALSRDGASLAVIEMDGAVTLHPPRSAAPVHRLDAHLAGPDGWASTGDGRHLVTPGDDRQFRFWEVATGRLVRQVAGLKMARLGFAAGDEFLWGINTSHGVRVWDHRTGDRLPWTETPDPPRAEGGVVSVRHGVIAGADDRTGIVSAVRLRDGAALWSHPGRVVADFRPALAPDERWVAFVDGATLRCKALLTGEDRWPPVDLPAMPGQTHAAALGFTPDGRFLLVERQAMTVDGDFQKPAVVARWLAVLDAATGRLERELVGPADGHGAWSLLADGRRVTAEGFAGVRSFDLATGAVVATEFPFRPAARTIDSPAGRFLVEADDEGGGRYALVVRGDRSAFADADRHERAGEVIREHYALAASAEGQADWFAARFHLRQLLRKDPDRAEAIRKRLAEVEAKMAG